MNPPWPCCGISAIGIPLRPQLRTWGLSVGRDILFRLARRHGLLAPRPHNPRRTTRPGHFHYPNRLAQATLTAPGQAWVADITYVFTETGHRYGFLLMDAYSRFIVGWHLRPSLVVEGALQALVMAQKSQPPHAPGGLHHSDHGIQYTAHTYQASLHAWGCGPAWGVWATPTTTPWPSGSGTLKGEYRVEGPFPSEHLARQALQEAVSCTITSVLIAVWCM